ncbi:MAG: glycoside hydrolase family 97 protein [Bacteroidales bacterium]
MTKSGFYLTFGLILCLQFIKAQEYKIFSPDKKTKLTIGIQDKISYTIHYENKVLIAPSNIFIHINGLEVNSESCEIEKVDTNSINQKIIPFVKEKRALIPDIYNELKISFKNRTGLNFRVYNDGVAYQFQTDIANEIIVVNETAEFNLPAGSLLYYPAVSKRPDADIFHTSFEENYNKSSIDTLKSGFLAFTPVLAEIKGLPKLLISESDVKDYPGMFLEKGNLTGLIARFAPYPLMEKVAGREFRQKIVTERADFIAKTNGKRTFPWRVVAIAPTDADILLNDLVYRLAAETEIKDKSWIKPGKSTEEWITGLNLYGVDFEAGLNTATYKYYIDFAKRFGFEYVMLDAGWSDVNDLLKITPGMDMEEITSYASKNKIGLILWTQALTLQQQMEQAFAQFKKWGIKIIMTDFIDRNDQAAINFMSHFADECAKNHFMCMIHGAPVPAGFSRTWPNMLTREAVLGSEYNAWSTRANPDHDLLLPFIRMFSGPMDYEPGLMQNSTKNQPVKMGFEKVIAQGTLMHQMAMFVVYESPLQLFSGNLSDAIREPDLMGFLGKIPTTWDETLIFEAELGNYILEARRNKNTWYIAGINNWEPKEFSLPLDFLAKGTYLVQIARDGINAARNPQDYKIEKKLMARTGHLLVKLAPGGGYLAKITKIND